MTINFKDGSTHECENISFYKGDLIADEMMIFNINDVSDIAEDSGGKTFSTAIKYTDFLDDKEKMKDFAILTKEEFLMSYSYLTEEEYDLTAEKIKAMNKQGGNDNENSRRYELR